MEADDELVEEPAGRTMFLELEEVFDSARRGWAGCNDDALDRGVEDGVPVATTGLAEFTPHHVARVTHATDKAEYSPLNRKERNNFPPNPLAKPMIAPQTPPAATPTSPANSPAATAINRPDCETLRLYSVTALSSAQPRAPPIMPQRT